MKASKLLSFALAAVMSVSAMAVPVSAAWYKTQSGQYYYTDKDGDICIGWRTINGEKYYFDDDGYMKTGWLKTTSGKRYYLKSDGKMAHDCKLKINGEIYSFDANGVATKGSAKKKVSLEYGLSFNDFKNSSNFSSYSATNADNVFVKSANYADEDGYFFLCFLDDELASKGYLFNYSALRYYDIKDYLTNTYGKSSYIDGEYVWRSKSSDIAYFHDDDGIYIYFFPKGTISYVEETTTVTTTTTTTTSTKQSRTVYVTKTGKKYHYNSHCNGGTYYESTLEEAQRRGLGPCNKCVN